MLTVTTTSLPAVSEQLSRFNRITLAEIGNLQLANRFDSKFLFHRGDLDVLLRHFSSYTDLLEVNGETLQGYKNLYYDTADFQLYHAHHNGLRSRYKVRERTYLSSGDRFLEIKEKNNRNLTLKNRLPLASDEKYYDFLDDYLPVNFRPLLPSLRTEYGRISLLSQNRVERMTIDIGLTLTKPNGDDAIILEHLGILELKAESQSYLPVIAKLKKQLELHQTPFSKYSIGCALQYPHLKQNLFKPTLARLRTSYGTL